MEGIMTVAALHSNTSVMLTHPLYMQLGTLVPLERIYFLLFCGSDSRVPSVSLISSEADFHKLCMICLFPAHVFIFSIFTLLPMQISPNLMAWAISCWLAPKLNGVLLTFNIYIYFSDHLRCMFGQLAVIGSNNRCAYSNTVMPKKACVSCLLCLWCLSKQFGQLGCIFIHSACLKPAFFESPFLLWRP